MYVGAYYSFLGKMYVDQARVRSSLTTSMGDYLLVFSYLFKDLYIPIDIPY